jgi:hypothetical protein
MVISLSMIYRNLLSRIYFISFVDRCREYRQLLVQDYFTGSNLTKEQRERIEVISFLMNTQYNTILSFYVVS